MRVWLPDQAVDDEAATSGSDEPALAPATPSIGSLHPSDASLSSDDAPAPDQACLPLNVLRAAQDAHLL